MRPGHRKEIVVEGSGRENVTCWTKKMAEETGSAELHGEWKRRCLASWAVVNGF